jgi:superfamily II DNA/RNA helicase
MENCYFMFSKQYPASTVPFKRTVCRAVEKLQFTDLVLGRKKDKNLCFCHMRHGLICLLLVYLQTRKTASWLAEKMSRDGHAVALLSGDLTVDQRIAVLDRFRDGKEKVLITTNVLARGEPVD